jgi:hypothetical protein
VDTIAGIHTGYRVITDQERWLKGGVDEKSSLERSFEQTVDRVPLPKAAVTEPVF